MSVILLRCKKNKPITTGRPTQCPYCGSELFQRWGEVTKSVGYKETQYISLYRYRCECCNRTFRDYPGGIDRSQYLVGTKQLAALIWALGYSYRDTIRLFEKYDITLSRSTVWREGQALADKLDGRKLQNYRDTFNIDKNYIHQVSSHFGVVVAVDVGGGQYAILGTLDESDPGSVRSWLKPLIRDAEIDIMQLKTGKLDLLHRSKAINTAQLMA